MTIGRKKDFGIHQIEIRKTLSLFNMHTNVQVIWVESTQKQNQVNVNEKKCMTLNNSFLFRMSIPI